MTIEMSTPLPTMSAGTLDNADRTAVLKQLIDQRLPLVNMPDWVVEGRDRNLTLIQEQALPTSRDEDWRFSDPARLYQTAWAPATPAVKLEAAQLSAHHWPEATQTLVFINGHFAPEYSTLAETAGLTVTTLASADQSLAPYLGHAPGAGEVFTALNSCNFTDAAVIKAERSYQNAAPIHILFVAAPPVGIPTITYPRLLVVTEAGSELTLIEDYISLGDTPALTNAVSEIWLAANAQVHHIRIQREQLDNIHVGKTAVTQERDSRYRSVAIGLGGAFARHTPDVVTTGAQTETVLDGLSLSTGSQLSDTHSAISFTQPHCQAQQLHKCIVSDRARAVFNGKVFVPKAAQQTNAAQLSRNLLLSSKARVDTKPQLEIIADDVKCAHGATVSQLDDDEIFYLQSRGLNHDNACDLLVKAFAAEILAKSPIPSIQDGLLTEVLTRLR